MTRVSHYILFVHWTQTIADPLDSNIFYTEVCMSVRVGGSVYLYTHTFKKEEWEEMKERGWFEA